MFGGVKAACKRCGKYDDSTTFVLDQVYKMMVCRDCVKERKEKENMSKETFSRGPYRYTRNPTNFGLFLLMLSFGIIMNALFIIVFSVLSFIFNKFIFIKKEEEILAKKYGTPYLEYKKSVKF